MPAITNAMTVDVEDYFQVSAFENSISREDWDNLPIRVEANTQRILDLFAAHDTKATFFMLGWVAERFPGLVKRIVAEGHELASHGYNHRRATDQTPAEFEQDIREAKDLLESIAGVAVTGYRAPSYSIGESNTWAHDILAETGHSYSSSVYPVKTDLYGMPDAPRYSYQCREQLQEIPITTLPLNFWPFQGKNMPVGGGGYFRLYPYAFSKWAFRKINEQENQPAIFYFHPWEIDPDQPKQHEAPLKSRFRHYLNLSRMETRVESLLKDFKWGRMDQVFMQSMQDEPAVDHLQPHTSTAPSH